MNINSTTDIFGKEKVSMPLKLSLLRQRLNMKSSKEKKFRFYSLYDHLLREDTLWTAWHLVRSNQGAAGVDGISISWLTEDQVRVERMIEEIREELRERTYRPSPVRRVYIPKKNGKLRPLGIPTIKDRVVQQAAHLILEPIFESDFLQCSYGFRPGKSAHHALRQIHANVKEKYTVIYDADIKGYFDSIPHDKLLKCLEMRIADRRILCLIRMWLKTPYVEEANGKVAMVSGDGKGTPQGGVISPLLSNIYLHWFDKAFHKAGSLPMRFTARLIRYADDFVVMLKSPSEQIVNWIEEKIESWLGLEINREKTRIVELRAQGEFLDFLGFTFKFVKSWKYKGNRFAIMVPSNLSIQREKDKIRLMLGYHMGWKDLKELAEEVSRQVFGWSKYFSLGYFRKAFNVINGFLLERSIRFLRKRSQKGYKFPKGITRMSHLETMGFRFLSYSREP